MLRYEYKLAFAAYLATETKQTKIKSLLDVIAFEDGQAAPRDTGLLTLAAHHDVAPETYTLYEQFMKGQAKETIDNLLSNNGVDALAMVSYAGAEGVSLSALSGYPSLTVPASLDSQGVPFGLLLFGGPGSDALLLSLAQVLERGNPAIRQKPLFTGY